MGELVPVTLLKLGGSLITHKDVPLSVNWIALKRVANAISDSRLPSKKRHLVLVHGGGSFGHYYAGKFGLSMRPKAVPAISIAKTTESMVELHSAVLRALVSARVAPETILAQELITRNSNLSAAGKQPPDNLRDRVCPSARRIL